MQEQDKRKKMLEDYADVFADIVNVLLFNGEEKIRPGELAESLTRQTYLSGGKPYDLERDVARYWDIGGVRMALLGLENQSRVEKEMPLRVIGYDGVSYQRMHRQREAARRKKQPLPPLIPVITLVLYFGEERWEQPKSLRKALDIPSGFEEYVEDYPIHVFELQYLPDETVKKFRSPFYAVAAYLVNRRKVREGKTDLLEIRWEDLMHIGEVISLLYAVTGDRAFEEVLKSEMKEQGVYMPGAYQQFIESIQRDGVRKGREEGLEKGLEQGLAEGRAAAVLDLVAAGELTCEQAARYLEKTPEEIRAMLEASGKQP